MTSGFGGCLVHEFTNAERIIQFPAAVGNHSYLAVCRERKSGQFSAGLPRNASYRPTKSSRCRNRRSQWLCRACSMHPGCLLPAPRESSPNSRSAPVPGKEGKALWLPVPLGPRRRYSPSELSSGKIDRHAHPCRALILPCFCLMTDLAQNPFADGLNKPAFLGTTHPPCVVGRTRGRGGPFSSLDHSIAASQGKALYAGNTRGTY
jgi:hypothetical protein